VNVWSARRRNSRGRDGVHSPQSMFWKQRLPKRHSAASRLYRREFYIVPIPFRSYAPGFHLTPRLSLLPPSICSRCDSEPRSGTSKPRLGKRRPATRIASAPPWSRRFRPAGPACPVMSSDTHIVPLFVATPKNASGPAICCWKSTKSTSRPINYPKPSATAPIGCVITPSPLHDDGLIDSLAESLVAGPPGSSCGLPLDEKSLPRNSAPTPLPKRENPPIGVEKTTSLWLCRSFQSGYTPSRRSGLVALRRARVPHAKMFRESSTCCTTGAVLIAAHSALLVFPFSGCKLRRPPCPAYAARPLPPRPDLFPVAGDLFATSVAVLRLGFGFATASLRFPPSISARS